MDPFELRQRNIIHEGDVMPAYYGQVNTSCALDRCLKTVHDRMDWDHKYPVREIGNGKVCCWHGHGHAGLRHRPCGRGQCHAEN